MIGYLNEKLWDLHFTDRNATNNENKALAKIKLARNTILGFRADMQVKEREMAIQKLAISVHY